MFSFFKNHPFAVEAFFESSLVATFAIPKENIEHLIPKCMELDTFHDKWAFVAAAMVQTKDLRPKGFPRLLGNDFFLIGYRVFVRFTNSSGRSLRGLYILRSETNKRRMEVLGNIFTHYRYTTTDIDLQKQNGNVIISSNKSGFLISFEEPGEEQIALPADSPFADWKEARKFAGPLPFTFTYNDKNSTVLIVEGVRKNWKPFPVKVINYSFPFLDDLGLSGFVLANTFLMRNVPYYWKKGRKEKWQN